jgi:hypothetical protein
MKAYLFIISPRRSGRSITGTQSVRSASSRRVMLIGRALNNLPDGDDAIGDVTQVDKTEMT